MAAVLLRRNSASLTTTSATSIVSAVPSLRALVISKIIVAASGTSTLTLTAGGTVIANALPMTAGQVYTETGLVLVAGETLTATAGTANFLTVSMFGEEVALSLVHSKS